MRKETMQLTYKKRHAYLVLILFIVSNYIPWIGVYTREAYAKQVTTKEIMEHLSLCESSNNPWAINNKEIHGKSYGLYQFRLDTFQHFGKRYGLPHNDIFNPLQQRDIVKKMIEEGRWSHWFNCLSIYFNTKERGLLDPALLRH